MFNKLKSLFGQWTKVSEPRLDPPSEDLPTQPTLPKEPELTEKEKATLAGEPSISILRVEVDPSNINNGSFELDWNDKFILNLIKAGYKQRENDTDTIIVDRWFQTVCRNIALEIYEQYEADPTNRDLRVIRSRDIGNGRTEVS